MKITRIQIKNYRGIECLDCDVSEHGFIATGGNAKGKTTVIRAIRAALLAQDISADAIRSGRDRAEVLIDLDDFTARRVIGPKKSSVSISQGNGDEARVIASKQAFLTELLGVTSLDPLELFLLRGKERRARVLAALPVSVTHDTLRNYAPDLPADFDVSGHGLEVLERARKRYYEARTEANRAVKDAAAAKADATSTVARVEAELAAAVPTIKGPTPNPATAPSELAAAESKRSELAARGREAELARARTETTRHKIAQLRESAEASADVAPIDSDLDARIDEEIASAGARVTTMQEAIKDLESRLAEAKRLALDAVNARDWAVEKWRRHEAEKADRNAKLAHAGSLREQADALEGAIAAVAEPPTAAELEAADAAVASAKARCAFAELIARAEKERESAKATAFRHVQAETHADALDVVVKALSEQAPAEVLASANAIPGLTLDGDEIFLDGVRLDALSGAEQLDLAIEIARRANAKSKILVCDGLERLDPEQFDRFVRKATAGGYQLLGTRVSSGDLVIEAIQLDDHEEAAAE